MLQMNATTRIAVAITPIDFCCGIDSFWLFRNARGFKACCHYDTQAKQSRKYRISHGLLRLRIAMTGYHFCKITMIPIEPSFYLSAF